MSITLEQLCRAAPVAKLRAAQFVEALNKAMAEFRINNPLRQAAFLAQVFHETGNLAKLEENLNYSAEGLMKTWSKRFPTLEIAKQYERNPKKIANKVYANRMGNGDEASGDGFKHKGAGLFQLTGKENQYRCALYFDIDPEQINEWLKTPEGASRSAALFWSEINGNVLADKGTEESFDKISKLINGGTIGLEHRRELYKSFRKVFGV